MTDVSVIREATQIVLVADVLAMPSSDLRFLRGRIDDELLLRRLDDLAELEAQLERNLARKAA